MALFGPTDRHLFAERDTGVNPENLLAAYFASSTVGVCLLDSDLRYLAINETMAGMSGRSASDHIGKTVREIMGEAGEVTETEFRRALLAGHPVGNIEISIALPTRKEASHWIKHYFPIKDESGAVHRIAVVVVDVTEQKKLQQVFTGGAGKLRQGMDRLQLLTDVSAILAANWSPQQSFSRISARIRRVLRHEYAGFELHDLKTSLLVRQAEDFPLRKNRLSNVPVSSLESPGGRALQQGEALIFSKNDIVDFKTEITANLLAEGLCSLCCVPMVRPCGPIGVLVLGSTRQDAFQPDDIPLLNLVASHLALAVENHRTAAELEVLEQRIAEERHYLEGEIKASTPIEDIVGDSPELKKVLSKVRTVASTDATVLILGETGTGKELIARAIHLLGRQKDAAFVKLNCAAIPTGLLESELFGHEKGAFTGAISQKIGRMELADGGTLFLDEVGEIPLELQPKLLRFLQDREFERLGSNHTIRVNLRLIAATNRDLVRSMALHEFRSDLFYRLSVFPIHLPALRERREDIPLLVRYFVRKFAARMGRHIESIPSETMKVLTEWWWPGNIRELENLMERSVIMSEHGSLRVPLSELHSETGSGFEQSLDGAERKHILRVLRECHGIISGPDGASRRLGVKRTTLQSRMRRLHITRDDYSNPDRK